MRHDRLLLPGLAVLIAADLVLAWSSHWAWVGAGVALWGLHLGITQGLLATMVADTAPADLRGTAFGVFNLACGLAMLAASVIAGLLWDRFGSTVTFLAGAAFGTLAIAAILSAPRRSAAGPDGGGGHPGGADSPRSSRASARR
jgi:MFS family permease